MGVVPTFLLLTLLLGGLNVTQERINCYVDGEVYGITVENGRLELREGFDDPTIRVYSDPQTFNRILNSDDQVETLKSAFLAGKIRVGGITGLEQSVYSIVFRVRSMLRERNPVGQLVTEREEVMGVADILGFAGYTTPEAQKLINNNSDVFTINAGISSQSFPVQPAKEFLKLYPNSSVVFVFQSPRILLFATLDGRCVLFDGGMRSVECDVWIGDDNSTELVDSIKIGDTHFVRFSVSGDLFCTVIPYQPSLCFNFVEDPSFFGSERENELWKRMWEEEHENWERSAKIFPVSHIRKEIEREMTEDGWRRGDEEYMEEFAARYREKLSERIGNCDRECKWATSERCTIGKLKLSRVELLPFGVEDREGYRKYKRLGKLIGEISDDLDLVIFLSDIASTLSKGKILKIGTVQPSECKKAIMKMAELFSKAYETSIWITVDADVLDTYVRHHCEGKEWRSKIVWRKKVGTTYLCQIGEVIAGTPKQRLTTAGSRAKEFIRHMSRTLYEEMNVAEGGKFCKNSEFPGSLRVGMGGEEYLCWRVGK